MKKAKDEIEVPSDEVSPFMVFGDNSGAAALTKEVPQTQILEDLGFKIMTVPDDVKGDTSMGKQWSDITQLCCFTLCFPFFPGFPAPPQLT